MRYASVPLFFAVLFLSVMGCAKPMPEGLEKLYPVELTIVQEGVPLDGATVSLASLDSSLNFALGGKTNAEGKLTLYTQGKYLGIPAGKYKVRVLKIAQTELPPRPATLSGPEFEAWRKQTAGMKVESWSVIEKQYSELGTTPLELEVTGKTTSTFDVGKPGKYK